MNFEMPNFTLLAPEIFVLTMLCVILVIDLFLSDKNRVVSYLLSQATLVGAFLLTLWLFPQESLVTMTGTFVLDPMGSLLKMAIYVAAFLTFLYARGYLIERKLFKGEFYLLGLFGVLGMMIMVSAHSMLTIYMGLELLSLSMYAMVALQRDSATASEAAMKYFILGAMASAMLLYGMSMIYGLTGSLNLAEISQALQDNGQHNQLVFIFGLVFIIIGVAFKLGAVPFHMWVPDVYHGSPTAVTLYISTAPKLAAFAMLMRLLVDGLSALQGEWQMMITIIAVLSIALGNLAAIVQSNIKRMLAYSGISHIGFLLLGIVSITPDGYASALFYALVYVLMGLAAFGMVLMMSRAGFEADKLEDFKGLNERSPWFAAMMMIVMFSMAGVPPFLGFWAKLAVIQAVLNAGMIWLAITAVVFSVIGAFYYLRVVKMIYFDKLDGETRPIQAGLDFKLALSANGLAILGLGLYPGLLMALCYAVIPL